MATVCVLDGDGRLSRRPHRARDDARPADHGHHSARRCSASAGRCSPATRGQLLGYYKLGEPVAFVAAVVGAIVILFLWT